MMTTDQLLCQIINKTLHIACGFRISSRLANFSLLANYVLDVYEEVSNLRLQPILDLVYQRPDHFLLSASQHPSCF